MNSKRIEIVDFLRGLAVINMIIYHFLYTLVFVFGVELDFFLIASFYPYQQYIAWSFILLSGFSINLSKNILKNGLTVILSALAVTLVTYFFIPKLTIRFGILHFMGFSILIAGLFKSFFKKLNSLIGLVLSFAGFIYIWENGVEVFPFYERLSELNLFFLGFPNESFSSSDYFPILPWIFLFFTGYYIGRINEVYGNVLKKYDINLPIINFFGRHSLAIYLSHQILIYFCLTILRNIGII